MIPKLTIPEGTLGNWTIEKFSVSNKEAAIFNLGLLFNNKRHRQIDPGTYTRLYHKRFGIVMSDTPAEIRDHHSIIYQAKGDVLINGLGLGMILAACLEKQEVSHVTVIEILEDLIQLVLPHYESLYNGRFSVIQADALEYVPEKGKRFNVVWHDIWNDINYDNWEQYKLLHRRYGRRCDWQGSWCKRELQKQLREERNSRYY